MKKIKIQSGIVVLDDPNESPLNANTFLVKNGNWTFSSKMKKFFSSDLDTVQVIIAHEEHKNIEFSERGEYKHNITSPTGQIVFSDLDNYPSDTGTYTDPKSFFHKVCKAIDTQSVLDEPFSGFAFSTDGYGFSIFLKKEKGLIVSILISTDL
jgi:hypothetical protein